MRRRHNTVRNGGAVDGRGTHHDRGTGDHYQFGGAHHHHHHHDPGPKPIPSGSGCTPPGDILPDGDWFGFLEGVTVAADARLTFDLSCYFDGAQAEPAAVQEGHPVPLEFPPYIRKENPKVFDVEVAAGPRSTTTCWGRSPSSTGSRHPLRRTAVRRPVGTRTARCG